MVEWDEKGARMGEYPRVDESGRVVCVCPECGAEHLGQDVSTQDWLEKPKVPAPLVGWPDVGEEHA